MVHWDAAVQFSQEFRSAEPIRLEPKGSGGTDFRPAFTWVEENELNPVCLIYLTNLCCDWFPEPPNYPVLLVTDTRRPGSFRRDGADHCMLKTSTNEKILCALNETDQLQSQLWG